MIYSVQDNETGEIDYFHSDSTTVERLEFDEETGEPLNGTIKVRYTKHKHFQIPKRYLRATPCEEFENEMTGEKQNSYEPITVKMKPKEEEEKKPKETRKQYKHDDYIRMEGVKNDIILGYNKVSYRMFLIPTLFCFNVYIGFLIAILESFLHFWAHMKNGLNMNKKVFYRSPLHVLTSQFCAVCRSESEMEIQLFEMLNRQMRKARTSKTLKDVTKVIT